MDDKKTANSKIAIIGIGLTLPGGAADPDSLWDLLKEKRDATVDIPGDRWDIRRFYAPYGSEKPGKMYVKRGGFLQGEVGAFDPLFFGISPREASVLDSQQRLLLEVTAKALQDAGITEDACAKSNMGVFVGGFCMDAKIEAASIYNRDWGLSQSATGSTATLLSNRLSYVYDLKGPSLTVDTACSSSLVAAHLAVESIRAGECETALVGGVNVMTQPEHFIEMCKAKLLSKDGRCFTWDKRANGYARGEGAGVLVLKRLSQALTDKDHIYAVIEATGVNQDGTTQGVSQPNPQAQAVLIRAVLEKAGLTPADVGFVEAHGTGTQAGDKAETQALEEVFGPHRTEKLVIGSMKTNTGHLEAAAGVAGLIKACLILQRGKIPANLHFETPNPEIPFERMCLKVPTEMLDWPRTGRTRRVGVNSFGYGGTNAHVILSEAPAEPLRPDEAAGRASSAPLLLPLSAKSKESLKALASQYAQCLQRDDVPAPEFLRRVSVKRSHYERRALVQAADRSELVARLESFARGDPSEGVAHLENPAGPAPLTFVYSGMGPQWWGMGQELMAAEPLFLEKIEECDEVFQRISGWSLLKEMRSGEASSRMARTQVAQPANFALQVALTALWRSWGIVPAAVVGHSVGEVTSAYVSGILSLEDALRVSYHRSRLQGTLAGQGGMLAVGLPEDEVRAYLEDLEGRVSVAAVNSPGSVTLAGQLEPLSQLAELFRTKGVFNRALQVEVAYHSPLMDPIESELKDSLRAIEPRPAALPCYSTVSGRLAGPGDFGAAYWWANVRQAVHFAKAVETLCDQGFKSFLEIGPHPVLTSSVKEVLAKKRVAAQCHTSLNRKTPEHSTLLHSLGLMYVNGYSPDWRSLQKGQDRYLALPAYPWQRAQHGNGTPKFFQDKFGEPGHPILNRNLQLPEPSWEVTLTDSMFPYLKDHAIGGKTVVPGAFFVEAALALNFKLTGQRTGQLRNVSFERILPVADEMDAEEKRLISTVAQPGQVFKVYSTTTAREETWTLHAQGELAALAPHQSGNDSLRLQDHAPGELEAKDIDAFYRTISETGLCYGPHFRPIKNLRSDGLMVYAEVEDTLGAEVDYILSPTVLDSVFQTLFAFGLSDRVPFVPVRIERLAVRGEVPSRCKILGRLSWRSKKSLRADFVLFDEMGTPVVEVAGVTCQALAQADNTGERETPHYLTVWQGFDPDSAPSRERSGEVVALLSSRTSEFAWLSAKLSETNTVVPVDLGRWSKESFAQLLRERSIDTFILLPELGAPLDGAFEHSIALSTRVVEVAQAIQESCRGRRVELLLCTHRTQKVLEGDRIEGLSLSPLWGLGRTINTECPDILCSCVDFEALDRKGMSKLFDAVLSKEPGVRELAIRGTELYQHTLTRRETKSEELPAVESPVGQRVAIDDLPSPTAPSVLFRAAERLPELEDDAVEIEIDHMVLSRWDQANSRSKIYPDDPSRHFFRYQAGMQGVGVIRRKGASVRGLEVGSRVLAVFPLGLSNFAVLPARYVLEVPASLGDSNLPDLYELARAAFAMSIAGPFERAKALLVKGVWGTFARALLERGRAAGLRLTFVDDSPSPSSRSQADAIPGLQYLAADDGAWVDSPVGADQAVDIFINDGARGIASLRRVKPFGKVVDFLFSQSERRQVSAMPSSTVAYHMVDFDALFCDHFEAVKELLAGAIADLGKPLADALPEFPLREIQSAVRLLEDGSSSSVVMRMKDEVVPLCASETPKEIRADGTYLVTGGTRGFGLQCARWLASQGARHLVLLSRSGLAEADAEQAVQQMKAQGLTVKVCALDIGDREGLHRAMAEVRREMPPIKGVIHSAMVLDDALLARTNEAHFRRVMRPKVQGALNLHEALANESLEFFLMFSSISSLIGNSGQASYVAANAFLDSFAFYLASRNVPAKTINWGVLSDAGVLANDAALVKVLERAGIRGISSDLALEAMARVLRRQSPQTGVFDVEWSKWASANPSLSRSSLYRELLEPQPDAEREKLLEVLETIIDFDTDGRTAYVQRELRAKFGEIFRMSPEAIDAQTSIIKLGVDSLIATEISVALRSLLGVDIPPVELLSGPSIQLLSARVTAQLEAMIEDAGACASSPPVPIEATKIQFAEA